MVKVDHGTDGWAAFHRKMGSASGHAKVKAGLSSLSMAQLKHLAKKYDVKVKGKVVEDWFDSNRKPPSKQQYVKALSNVVSDSDIISARSIKPIKKRKKRADSWSIW